MAARTEPSAKQTSLEAGSKSLAAERQRLWQQYLAKENGTRLPDLPVPTFRRLTLQLAFYGVSEASLLRDALYVLQGVNGLHLRFQVASPECPSERLVVHPGLRLPNAVRTLMLRIGEAGWHYRRVSRYVAACAPSKSGALVGHLEGLVCQVRSC